MSSRAVYFLQALLGPSGDDYPAPPTSHTPSFTRLSLLDLRPRLSSSQVSNPAPLVSSWEMVLPPT